MQDSKAIRPEIKGLFDSVRQQALLYAEAFEILDRNKLIYESMTGDMKNITADAVLKINHEMSHLKEKYDNIIKILQIESAKVTEKYTELKDLKGLQDSYFSALESIKLFNENIEKQSNEFKREYNEFKREIVTFRKRTDEEIQTSAEKFRSIITESVNEEFKPFENKLISRQKLIESRILKNEQNYWNFLDQYQNDMKKFSQEIEVLKNVLTTLTKANTLPVDELKIQLNEYIHSVEPKIIYFDDTINKLLNKTNSFEYQANMKKASESGMSSVAALSSLDSENEFKKMIVLSRELKEENNILNNKVTWMISISIISFLAAAIALVMRFI